MDRRKLFLNTARGGAFLAAGLMTAQAQAARKASLAQAQSITIIDLDCCDGCTDRTVPECVAACRKRNEARYPEPKKPLSPYWPQKIFEDFSEERDRIDRLTPYNWIFVQRIEVNGRVVFAPRRCMHCFDAPCRKLCPFGAIDKTDEGATKIDERVCFGGAKCRDVCPWGIPQRQAGVGIYLNVAPKFAGGGVMYKCDGCADRELGTKPACVGACPKGAMHFGTYDEMLAKLEVISQGRFVYGRKENGGTATWYVSSVPFEMIEQALIQSRGEKAPQGEPGFKPAQSQLDQSKVLAGVTLAAPVIALGGALALRKRRGDKGDES